MASNRTVYHVVPNSRANEWVISRENDDTFREQRGTEEEAVDAAKERAPAATPSRCAA